jgi:hypothetical protein
VASDGERLVGLRGYGVQKAIVDACVDLVLEETWEALLGGGSQAACGGLVQVRPRFIVRVANEELGAVITACADDFLTLGQVGAE